MRARPTRSAIGGALLIAVAVTACQRVARDAAAEWQQKRDQSAPAKSMNNAFQMDGAVMAAASAPDPLAAMFAARKLIRSAEVFLEVARYEEAAARALRIAEANGGYPAETSASHTGEGVRGGSLLLRIPNDRFPRVLEGLKAVGKVRSETISTEEVSLAYTDLETRVRVKREAASRLREILRGRTAKLSDILEVEQALMAIVEEIEQMEGQRRFYDNRVALSTIRLVISEPAPLVRRGAFAPVGDALRGALGVLVGSLATFITLFVAALPWAILLAALLWLLRRALRRRALRRQEVSA
jgi:hypothetical protein